MEGHQFTEKYLSVDEEQLSWALVSREADGRKHVYWKPQSFAAAPGQGRRRLSTPSSRPFTPSSRSSNGSMTIGPSSGQATTTEKAERSDIGDVYLWTALDANTKLLVRGPVPNRDSVRVVIIWTISGIFAPILS
jgi:hypothetical protein